MSEHWDDDGYPTEEALQKVKEWDWKDPLGCFEFMQSMWRYDSFRREDRGDQTRFEISTFGWSGNESIIYALEENAMMWALCWFSSQRGGHYVFQATKK